MRSIKHMRSLTLALLILMTGFVGTAFADPNPGQTGDMFGDIFTERPSVAGDPGRNADFFPENQSYVRSNKDMFDHIHMDAGVNDMFHTHMQGIPDDMINGNVHGIPDDKLYQWPKPPQ